MIATAAQSAEPVDYVRDVKPILARRCFACHAALKQQNGLRLDAARAMLKGGEQGPAIMPGKSGESLLIAAVTGRDGWRMPPEGDPLPEEEIGKLRAWIDQGAKAPDEPLPPDPRQHWSFHPPVRPAVPQTGAANPIDAFLAVEQQRLGLEPLGPTEKHVLLRRVYLDLIGLPPTRDELRAFLADSSPEAYENVVERLLASPHYGERWGRHWMDVWRYSDWAGYGMEARESQRHIWRWRDWIVESLNADKPYDRMIVEMLAGDEVAPADPDTLRATGFLARNWFLFNRNVWLDNIVEHTSKAFLGLTMNCARCHDHMYDPISQQDYYRFRAFFEPHQVRTDRVAGQSDTILDGLPHVYDADAAAATFLFVRGNEANPDKEHPLAPSLPAVFAAQTPAIEPVSLPPEAYYPALRSFVQQEMLAAAEAAAEKARAAMAQSKQALVAAEQQVAQLAALAGDKPVTEPPTSTLFIADDFSKPRPDVWQTGPGQWEYAEGRLLQKQTGVQQCWLSSLAPHPQDFTATFRFKSTGGNQWKSVGLSFDVDEAGSFSAVYLSAFAGGPKAQIYYRQKGADTYPAEGAKPLPIELNREYSLRVDVRGRLVNVSVDGQFALAYRLPHERTPGRLKAWAFDATAEFLSFEAKVLPPDARLTDLPGAPDAEPPQTVDAARAAREKAAAGVTLAERALVTAEASTKSVAARIAADRAKYASPPPADAESLAVAAGQAEREAAARLAEQNVLSAEQALATAQQAVKPDDEKTKQAATAAEQKLAEARQTLDAAQSAVQTPGPNYSPLDKVYPATSTGRRLALARWIASPDNPLAARAAVNQMWLRHFGDALVPTVFDLGVNGRAPSHPALLDWLAVEFVERGWSMKSLHRLIVTSAAYRRQSAAVETNGNAAKDPDNRYLWHYRSRRMEAELVRDSVLAVAGGLDPTMGGPDIDQAKGEKVPRRSIYFRHAHEKYMTFLRLFDSASANECYRRDESIVPQQALALANSDLALAQSRLLAGKLWQETAALAAGASEAAFVATAFEQVLCRPPSSDELAACIEFLGEQAARLAEAGKLSAFAGSAGSTRPAADPRQRARENLVHVLLNHNDFVTIR